MTTPDERPAAGGRDDPAAHADWDALNDLVDGRLGREKAQALELHLANCPACREQRDALRALSRDAAALRAEILPPDDLWDDVAASIKALQDEQSTRSAQSSPSTPPAHSLHVPQSPRPPRPPRFNDVEHLTAPRSNRRVASHLPACSPSLPSS